mmetsp:Transcript_9518/g.20578  ORF Transcript_9518/g.20578 Transcript_9518/m.20578 type:complete len:281 (-) Transcript_9518:674-1516(-)
MFVKIQNLTPRGHPSRLLSQQRIDPPGPLHGRIVVIVPLPAPVRTHVGPILDGLRGRPSDGAGIPPHAHGGDVRLPQHQVVLGGAGGGARPPLRDAATNIGIECTKLRFVLRGVGNVAHPRVIVQLGRHSLQQRMRLAVARVDHLGAQESRPQSTQLLGGHGILYQIVPHVGLIHALAPRRSAIRHGVLHVHLSVGGTFRLLSQPIDLRAHFQKVDDVIGRDAHVVLEGREEIVLHQLVPDHEAMLPAQPVGRRFDPLFAGMFEILIELFDVIVGRGVQP